MLPNRQQGLGAGSSWNVKALGAFLALVGALVACQGPPPRSRDWSEEPIVPGPGTHKAQRAGGDPVTQAHPSRHGLRIHMDADPGSLNPFDAPSEWSRRITTDTVFETLVRYQPVGEQGQGSYQSGLARSWTVSPGGREIRISLHESAHWQDGKAVSALDVQFSLEAVAGRRVDAEHYRQTLADVSAVEIINRSELRIRLTRENAFVLRELAAIPILPEHIYFRNVTQSKGTWVGSGPYQVTSESDEGVVLERDPNYWGQQPAIERVEFVREQDAAMALRDAKEGQMDVVPELIPAHFPEQLEAPGFDQKFSVVLLAPPLFNYVVLNTMRAPFEDSNARRAIAQLVDPEALIEAEGGLARSVSSPIWPGGPGNGPAIEVPAFSVSEAAALLEQAGWRDDDGDGVRARDGHRLMISVLATETPHPTRELVLSALRKAGFVLDVRVGSSAVLENRLRAGDYDLAFASWSGDFDRDLSPLLGSGGALNYGGFRSPVVDEILAKIRATWDPAQRVPQVGRLAQALRASTPLVALPAPYPRGLVHKRIRGLRAWNGWFSIRDLSVADEDE